ncbi:MAG: preprotein translocase subunit SecE [Deltaproteobacteria bacterium]|jgi:preprotein translocase SecE subunit|nr:MAG: preprotein translocase subunit SecE [Deltaproteobacteria bacterium]
MKKKKAHRRKGISRRSNVKTTASIPKEKGAGRVAIPDKEDLRPTPLKKDFYKRVENGVFAPKRYFIVARQFLVDAKVELKKVTWPTKKELLSATAVVLLLVILIAFFLGIVDLGLVKIIKNVVG